MSSKNNKISFGKNELDDLEFEPQNVKIRITTMLDEDILIALKKIAKTKGQKYQTLLNQILRAYLELGKSKTTEHTEKRIRQIVREELKKRA